ncbi:MAG: endonuclease V [Nitrososphaerales archaeon]
MPLTIDDAIQLQLRMAKTVIRHDVISFDKIRNICGVDVSYHDDRAYASAIVMDRYDFDVIGSAHSVVRVKQPYVPGLLFLHESEPILSVLSKYKDDYNVLMVDGHGVLHPREFGLACYIGTQINKPTIGIAKSLLCGRIANNGSGAVLLNGNIVGYAINTSAKPIFVSVGHKISLRMAVRLVKEVSKYRIPEPLRLADINSRKRFVHD